MRQQEIEFFWPLTEQIPLDLDYSDCVKPKLTTGRVFSVANGGTGAIWTTTSFRMQENQTTMLVVKKPNLLRRMIYNIIGFKWEVN